jgi:hypothetical protein
MSGVTQMGEQDIEAVAFKLSVSIRADETDLWLAWTDRTIRLVYL